MNHHIKYSFLCIISMLILIPTIGTSQTIEQDIQSRYYFELKLKPVKKLKLKLSPEFRFDNSFNIDKYFFELDAQYKVVKFASIGASYRFVVNPRDVKATEYLHRWAFNIEVEHKINRFDFSFKPSFTNYNDDLSFDKYLRYKLKAKYNVPKIPLTLAAYGEAFHQTKFNQLSKMRYGFGMNYKLAKKHAIGLDYKLDYFLQEYYNKHIISLGYTYKF